MINFNYLNKYKLFSINYYYSVLDQTKVNNCFQENFSITRNYLDNLETFLKSYAFTFILWLLLSFLLDFEKSKKKISKNMKNTKESQKIQQNFKIPQFLEI